MINELVNDLRKESKRMSEYGVNYMATLLIRAADTIELLSEKLNSNRPQGEWIEDPINKNNMYCSNCKVSYTKDFLRGMSLYHEPKDMPNYCPNCGAHMKGADNE